MKSWEREYHVSRILSGFTRCKTKRGLFYIGMPHRDNRYIAHEIKVDVYNDAFAEELLTEEEAVKHLQRLGIWTEENSDQHEKLQKAIEDMKVGLFENRDKSNARFAIRTALTKGKEELERLERLKHSFDYVTCEGLASSAFMRFLIGCSIYKLDKSPYWQEPEVDWNRPDDLIDDVMEFISRNRLNEADVREIVRHDPWRGYWSTRNIGKGLVDVYSVDFQEELRAVIVWSTIYDSIREHPDAPGESILEDDDMTDGWMIHQRRQREAEQLKKMGDESVSTNQRIANADEVFIVANQDRTAEDAVRLTHVLTDPVAKNIKSQRMKFIQEKGEVAAVRLPDTWQEIQMEMNKLEAMRIREA